MSGLYWGIMEKKMETTIMGYIGIIGYMGGCQNYGPFLGYPTYQVPYYNRDPKRDHNFDNHPFRPKQPITSKSETRSL